MRLVLLIIASIVASSGYAGITILAQPVPGLDEFGVITLALVVGLAGARAIQRFKGRRKTDD